MAQIQEKNPKGKIYSELFTNLAVAWFSAGIIIPIFTPGSYPIWFFFIGLAGAIFSTISAIITKDIK